MKKLGVLLTLALALPATSTLAHHKPGHHTPPGHLKRMHPAPAIESSAAETVCLVQTSVPNDPHAEVVWSEWLPRPVAEEAAATEGGFIILHPSLQTERDCWDFLRQ